MSRNLVLTSIYELSAEAVEPFFHSLRLSRYQDEIAVFVTRIPADCRALLQKYGVTVIDSEYRGLPMAYANLARRLSFALKAVGRLLPEALARRKGFPLSVCQLLEIFLFPGLSGGAGGSAASRAAGRRSRRGVSKQPVFVSLSTRNFRRVRMHPRNHRTIARQQKMAVGSGSGGWQTRRLIGKTAVCAGTTLADHATMTKYLELMTSHLNRRFFWALFDSIDQGLHNYFVHNRLIAPLYDPHELERSLPHGRQRSRRP